jgi:signal transduction histidine kinase
MRQLHTASVSARNAPAGYPLSVWATWSGWVFVVGTYTLVAVVASKGPHLTAFGDIAQCLAALFACAGLFSNSLTSDRRTRAFWALLGFGTFSWFCGQVLWTYVEVVLHKEAPNPFAGDIILFLHPVPMIAALALKPHDQRDDVNARVGYLDFSLLLLWWVYLYLFIVIPWQFVSLNVDAYGLSYDYLQAVENLVLVVGFAALMRKASGNWRLVYAHLFSASLIYAVGAYIADRAIDINTYYTGGPYDLPLVASFVWFGTAGFVAHRLKPAREELTLTGATDNPWPARLAALTVFSIPLMALWSLWLSRNSSSIRVFRVGVSQIALLIAGFLLFLRQRLVNRDRLRLLHASRESLESLKQFQSQLIQTEKLVSIGQLAAGAAHEINNPLTGILGYSDLLADDPSLPERPRAVADKIRILARRIKTHVTSLLSFARRVPSEKNEIDLNIVVASAINLTNLDLRGKRIEILTEPDSELPAVLGDANQILQVFFNLISNAVDALEEAGGGKLTIRTAHRNSKVIVDFSDTGPGMKSPLQVFDPFFTTKPAGKGTGLGLSICYGIVQDHNGRIYCFNRPQSGATFVVELPVAPSVAARATKPALPAKQSEETNGVLQAVTAFVRRNEED